MSCLAALCRKAGAAPWCLGAEKLFGHPQGIPLHPSRILSTSGAALLGGRALSYQHQQLLFAKAVLKKTPKTLITIFVLTEGGFTAPGGIQSSGNKAEREALCAGTGDN